MTSEYSQEAVQAMKKDEIRVAFVAVNFSEAGNWILQDALTRKWIQGSNQYD